MAKLRYTALAAVMALPLALLASAPAYAQTSHICPDGTYVTADHCHMAPDGTYVGGAYSHLAPDGKYVGEYGENSSIHMCADGSYAGGICHLHPDGTYRN